MADVNALQAVSNAPNEEPLSARGFSLWIDTCVMIDISTDYQAVKNAPAGDHAVEETRLNMQRAYWLGVALDQQGARTIGFKHETMGNLDRYAPPGSDGASFISAFAWILKDFVFPKWDAHLTTAGQTIRDANGAERPTTNDERDQFMIDESKAHGLAVITRDGPAYKRAKAVVRVFRPNEYARSVLPLEAARDRFFERAEVGVVEWVNRNGGATAQNQRAVEVLWTLYSAIWAPPGAFSR
jgi:hypothetical protein